jgi:hypothetical protein
MRLSAGVSIVGVLALVSCASGAVDRPSGVDEGARAAAIVQTLRSMMPARPAPVAVAARTLGPSSTSSSASTASLTPMVAAPRLAATLPVRAGGWLHLESGADHWIELAAIGVDDRPAASASGATVFAAARPGLDLMHEVTEARYEELRLARTFDAAKTSAWRFRLPAGHSLRVVADREPWLELLDADGRARLRTEPVFAIDAAGHRRPLALSIDGDRILGALDVDGLVAPIAIDPAWTTTGSLATGRFFGGFAVLSGGRALYVGGQDASGNYLSSAELFQYDAASGGGTWTSAGNLSVPRSSLAIAVVKRGASVVVVGGEMARVGSNGTSTAVDVYDVASGKWKTAAHDLSSFTVNPAPNSCARGGGGPVPPQATGVRSADGVASLDGEKLAMFAGQTDFGDDQYLRVYDMTGVPADQGTWTHFEPPMGSSMPGSGGWATLNNVRLAPLPDGRAVAIGGRLKQSCGGVEQLSPFVALIDKAFSQFVTYGNILDLKAGRDLFALTRIPDGRVVVTGGEVAGPDGTTRYASQATLLFDVSLYDAGKSPWVDGPLMPSARLAHESATLADGRVLVAGGAYALGVSVSGFSDALIYDPTATTGGWIAAGSMSGYHSVGAAGTLDLPSSGPVTMVVGGLANYYEGAFSPNPATELFAVAKGGVGCTGDGECASHHCVDGVCCDSACTGQCQACDVAGAVGTCSNVGGAPHGTRPSCAGGLACDATAGSCKSSCASDADCTSAGYFCDSGKCLAPLATGLPCIKDAACVSGHCVDGTCCESACGDVCAACDVPGLAGKCVPVKGAPHHASATCPGGGGADPCAQSLCDGKTTASCASHVGSDVSCRAASCSMAQSTAAASCDGSGACPAAVTKACTNFLQCDGMGVACLNECVSDKDCVSGYTCSKGICTAITDTCAADRLSVTHKDGTTQQCAPYYCNGTACGDTCASSADCQNGFICDATGHCAAATATSSGGKGGGCSVALSTGGARRTDGIVFVTVGLALALARTRRRARRP